MIFPAGLKVPREEDILDAYEDLQKDISKNRCNPFKEYEGREEELKNRVDRLISMSLGFMAQSIDKLDLKVNVNIIENIIYSGVYLRYKNILNKGCEINVQPNV